MQTCGCNHSNSTKLRTSTSSKSWGFGSWSNLRHWPFALYVSPSSHRRVTMSWFVEYLNIWSSSRIFFLRASHLGTTSLSLNQRVPSASSQKQVTFGSPSHILLLMWPMPSSSFWAAMISAIKVGVRVWLNNDRMGNTRVLHSSPVKRTAGK
jgi:hypothetical protein